LETGLYRDPDARRILWTECAKNVADLLRCRQKNSVRSPVKAVALPMKREPLTSGHPTKRATPVEKEGRFRAADVAN